MRSVATSTGRHWSWCRDALNEGHWTRTSRGFDQDSSVGGLDKTDAKQVDLAETLLRLAFGIHAEQEPLSSNPNQIAFKSP